MISQDSGDIALATGLAEEDAKVFHPVVFMVSRYHEANDDHEALHCDERAPHMKLIRQVRKYKGTDDRDNHRRRS